MKLQINKKLRFVLISILIILISISSFLLFREVRIPKYEEQTKAVYTYNNKASAKHTVILKPNNLYDVSTLDEGKVYITEFVDQIRASFNYEFSGERNIDIKGNYEIIAKVQGFTGEGENLKNIWEKKYIIVKKEDFDIEDKTKTIKEEVRLSLEPYNNFVKEVKETSNVSSQTMLTLVMNVNLTGEINKNKLEDTISPSLIIPLDSPMFEIGGNKTIDEEQSIEEIANVQIPVNSKQVIFYGVIIFLLLSLLILLFFFIEIAAEKDAHEKLLKKIFKKHGDRLVALNNEFIIDTTNTIHVKSIDDLVRIADEIGKPILYKYNQDHKEINMFYISGEEQVYLLDLNGILEKDESHKADKSELMEKE